MPIKSLRRRRSTSIGTLRGRHRTPRGRAYVPVQMRPRLTDRLPRPSRGGWAAIGSVAVAVLAVLLFVVPGPSHALISLVPPAFAPDEKPLPQSIAAGLGALPLSDIVAASGRKGLGITPPYSLPSSASSLSSGNKPEVLFICDEYNGQCADATWPLVIALEKFGEFHSLGYVVSKGGVNPGTVGLDFYRSSYSSKYISFKGVELYTTRKSKSGAFQTLQRMDLSQEIFLANWDVPPYSPGVSAVPFIDFGGPYYMASAGFDGKPLENLASTAAAALGLTESEVTSGSSKTSLAVQALAARMVGSVCLVLEDSAPVCHGLPKSLLR
ncbi:MAG TPA: DUF929 family protein, partial [Acidimicrobiales bacterium]|nr:DUF929 family protein [Acidimicrobiales bacterium]